MSNGTTRVLKYVPFRPREEFAVAHLRLTAIPVNHIVPTVGLIFSDQRTTIALTSDTAATDEFWQWADRIHVDALIVEASFPNSLAKLAEASGHLTPAALGRELKKLDNHKLDIRVVHLKAAYRETVIKELNCLGLPNLTVMEPGREYSW